MRVVPASVFLLLGFVGSVAPAKALIERTEERVLSVTPGARLEVEISRGHLAIEPGAGPEMRLVLRRAFATEKEEDLPRLQATQVWSFEEKDGVVSLRSRYEGERGPHPTWVEWPPVDATFELQVPGRTDVTAKGRHLDVSVGDLAGKIVVRLEEGQIFLRHIDGAVDAWTRNGNITLQACSGAVVLKAPLGGVQTGPLAGTAQVVAGAGDVEIQAVAGAVDARATTGDVRVNFAGTFSGEARLETDGGSVVAVFDPKTRCAIEASAGWFGRVRNKTALAVEEGGEGRNRLRGTLNGGGDGRVVLRASGGNVTLKTAPVPWEEAKSPAFAETR